jgi:predicted nucleic acid-binding protein
MTFGTPIPTYFFDASALVKLFVDEPDSRKAKMLLSQAGFIHTSWILLAEALGVMKRKWLKKDLTDHQYGRKVYSFFAHIREERFIPVDVGDSDGKAQLRSLFNFSAIDARRKYPYLDVADVIQFQAIRTGYLKYLVGESTPQLVTADRKLARAAESEGIAVIPLKGTHAGVRKKARKRHK